MRRAPWCALLCCVAASAAAQERAVTFEEPQPVSVTGFTVGRADYDRLARSNSFTAAKIGVSLFKPAGDVYLFAQLTTALEGAQTSTEIDNLLVSWTPQRADQWTVAVGRVDATIGLARGGEPRPRAAGRRQPDMARRRPHRVRAARQNPGVQRTLRSNGRRWRPPDRNAADPAVRDRGPHVVLQHGAGGHVQQHRAHALS